ncbi:UDP-glucose flavonoid 3-O-glucosyltransferase 7-like [Typha angustifolia]|uniref:UDP-glucose flavonoid 3-O-glucosyltransferase 7-like n=1 Tax=Typha angustifolia TaxID=59011 RepID=UPI003C2D78F2
MDLHVFFLPFLAPGHMIPMLDIAALFAGRGVRTTVVTTPTNAAAVPHHPNLHVLLLPPFNSRAAGLPDGVETAAGLRDTQISPAFIAATDEFEPHFLRLLLSHRPDCIVADVHFTWAVDHAATLGIPLLSFYATGFFSIAVAAAISHFKDHESVTGDDVPFTIDFLPHKIYLTRSQIPGHLITPTDLVRRMMAAQPKIYGMVMNTFLELEPEYAASMTQFCKAWSVGPVCRKSPTTKDRDLSQRGEAASKDAIDCLQWLDERETDSVIYICFGSMGRFTTTQLQEIARGLDSAGHPFVWVVKKDIHISAALPSGFKERVRRENRGVIINGWAPQVSILNHRAVGGFVTHCGWNSTTEAVNAGVAMVTWPLHAEQFFNERFLVDVAKIGVPVGVKAWSDKEEERELVGKEKVEEAVRRLMGEDTEAAERRSRARVLGETAKKAVEKGGSSYNELTKLLEEMVEIKTRWGKVGKEENVIGEVNKSQEVN